MEDKYVLHLSGNRRGLAMYDTDNDGRMVWASLEPAERKLAKVAALTAVPAFLLLCVPIAREGFAFGQWLRFGPGGVADAQGQFSQALETSPWFGAFVAFVIASSIASAIAWWRFSQMQDEMFHRIQNHTLGRTAGVGLALTLFFWALSLPGWVPVFPLHEIVMLELILLALFSADAWRRWG